jgi:hypothetical protein
MFLEFQFYYAIELKLIFNPFIIQNEEKIQPFIYPPCFPPSSKVWDKIQNWEVEDFIQSKQEWKLEP